MADNPITTPLPADLPTNWVYGQTIGPQGTDAGLTQQHGYNYLMQQVNAAQQAATQIGEAFSGLPSLGSDGKIPASQLPAMNYDPAGSAAAVQTNLTNHINNKNNPHRVTAAQVGAKADFSVLPVTQGGTGVPTLAQLAQSLFPSSIGNLNFGYNFAITGPGWADNGYMSFQALMSQIATNGVPRITTGSYVGDGNYGQSSPNSINTGNTSKFLIVTKDPPSFYSNNQPMEWFFWFPGITQVNVYSALADGDCAVSQSGATISWYNTDNASYQLNKSGTTYRWISFG